MTNILKQSFIVMLLGAILFAAQLFAFSEPQSPPPGANTPAPLHVGATGQSKAGGLILNTGGANYGLIVDQGSVGIGTQSPTQKLDVMGYVRGATGLCIGSDCRTGWPASGGGTVTSLSAGSGITLAPNPITTTGTISVSGGVQRYCARKTSSELLGFGSICPGGKVVTGFIHPGNCNTDSIACVECSAIEVYSC